MVLPAAAMAVALLIFTAKRQGQMAPDEAPEAGGADVSQAQD